MDYITIISIALIVFTIFYLTYVINKYYYKKTDNRKHEEKNDITPRTLYKNTNPKLSINYDINNNNKTINTNNLEDAFINCLVQHYYNGDEKFTINCSIKITPRKVLDYIDNKRLFPFQNGCTCTVNETNVTLEFKYTQGFRIFISARNPVLREDLNDPEIAVLNKIEQFCRQIISPQMSNMEKARTVHNFLISTSKYDQRVPTPDEAYTPYSLLFNHCAVNDTFMDQTHSWNLSQYPFCD
jgi:hypothetical protein